MQLPSNMALTERLANYVRNAYKKGEKTDKALISADDFEHFLQQTENCTKTYTYAVVHPNFEDV